VLSEGTRIGRFRILRWIREGGYGQSYEGEKREGEDRGKKCFLKLLPREISEKPGFSEYFHQECQALEQLQGPGICALRDFGVMKWKHWLSYDWIEGTQFEELAANDGDEPSVLTLKTLEDWMLHRPDEIEPDDLREIMVDLHRALDRAHKYGVIHGNLKPSNILVEKKEGSVRAFIGEFGLNKLHAFNQRGAKESTGEVFSSQSM